MTHRRYERAGGSKRTKRPSDLAAWALWALALALGSSCNLAAQTAESSESSSLTLKGAPSDFISLHFDPETERVLLEAGEETRPVVHVPTLARQIDWPLDRGTVRFDKAPAILTTSSAA